MKNANKKEFYSIASYIIAIAMLSLFPLYAKAIITNDQTYLQYINGVPYYTPYYSYDTPRYGNRIENGQTYYYLLPTQNLGGYSSTEYANSLASSISVSCAVSPLSARVGETILWYSSVTGGAGNYTYFWSGSDGLTGNTSSVRRTYDTIGNKYATITVTSGGQSITTGCIGALAIQPVIPAEPTQPGFGASCYATPEKISPNETATWLAVISGTLGTTTYSWSGTENLTGNQPLVEKTYNSLGAKQAFLTISSNGKIIIAPCANKITVAPKTTTTLTQTKPSTTSTGGEQARVSSQTNIVPLQGICVPSTTTADIDEPILWQATAIGGNGSYNFSWQGDEKLSGQNATTSPKTYKTAGAKNASVIISSINNKITVTCAPNIEVAPKTEQTGLLAASVFSNWTISFFFVLALILAVALFFSLVLRKKNGRETDSEQMPPIPHLPIQPTQELSEEPFYPYPLPEEEKED